MYKFVAFFFGGGGFNVYFCRRSYKKNTVFIQLQHEFYIKPAMADSKILSTLLGYMIFTTVLPI